MEYKITLGRVHPTDSTMFINDKEFSIDSIGWQLISIFWDAKNQLDRSNTYIGQEVLKICYDNYNNTNL